MAVDNKDAAAELPLFPGDVWERILDCLDDIKDVQSVLGAFSELDLFFQQKKAIWYFDQVCPHLFKIIDEEEKDRFITLCRRTCKRWCSATDSFIQNHPSRRAYQHNGINRRTVQYGQFSYDDWFDYGPNKDLATVEEIHHLQDTLTNHPNPGAQLKTFHIRFISTHQDEPEDYLEATLTFLKNLGKHIWNIALTLPTCSPKNLKAAQNIMHKIIKCLSFLPNVRKLDVAVGLHVHFPFVDNPCHWLKLKLAHLVPQLPNLEYIEFTGCNSFAQLAFLHHFKFQIKKLRISYDNISYSLCCTNLTELEIDFDDDDCSGYLNDYLTSAVLLHFPFLKKLMLSTDQAIGGPRIEMTVSNLFGILGVGRLEELDFECCQIYKDCTCFLKDVWMDTFPSVKYLKLTDHKDQELDFLTAFPSLEHLEILYADRGTTNGEQLEKYKETWRNADALTSTVRFYLYEAIVPATVNIWDKIPSLKLLTVVTRLGQSRFVRECGNKRFYPCLLTPSDDEDENEEDSDDGSDEEESSEDDVEMPKHIRCNCCSSGNKCLLK